MPPSPTHDSSTDPLLLQAALRAALEMIPAPAAIVTGHGAVQFANEAARAYVDCDPGGFASAVRQSLEPQHESPTFERRSLDVADHHLVIHRGAGADIAARTARWRARLGLTVRQAEVLELVAQGLTNGTIAEVLGCRERTVETHVSRLLSRAGTTSRAELVTRFWTEP